MTNTQYSVFDEIWHNIITVGMDNTIYGNNTHIYTFTHTYVHTHTQTRAHVHMHAQHLPEGTVGTYVVNSPVKMLTSCETDRRNKRVYRDILYTHS